MNMVQVSVVDVFCCGVSLGIFMGISGVVWFNYLNKIIDDNGKC